MSRKWIAIVVILRLCGSNRAWLLTSVTEPMELYLLRSSALANAPDRLKAVADDPMASIGQLVVNSRTCTQKSVLTIIGPYV
jgi:hypothetical protein